MGWLKYEGGDGGYNEALHAWNTRVWTDQERAALSDKIRDWHKQRAAEGLTCIGTPESQALRVKARAAWLNNGGREELSEKMQAAWRDPIKRETWMKAITSEEVTRKKSKANTDRYKDPEERVRTGKAVSAGLTNDGKRRIGEAAYKRHGYTSSISEINCAVCQVVFLPDKRTRRTCSTPCRRILGLQTRKNNKERRNER